MSPRSKGLGKFGRNNPDYLFLIEIIKTNQIARKEKVSEEF